MSRRRKTPWPKAPWVRARDEALKTEACPFSPARSSKEKWTKQVFDAAPIGAIFTNKFGNSWVKTSAGFKKVGQWPRRPLRARSKLRSGQMRIYLHRRLVFLALHPRCVVFPSKPATDIHHARGRAGTLLLDERFWLPVSRAAHRWIDDHPLQARRAGWLCAAGEWNRPPRDQHTEGLRRIMLSIT